jgi:DnaK suppressor protein
VSKSPAKSAAPSKKAVKKPAATAQKKASSTKTTKKAPAKKAVAKAPARSAPKAASKATVKAPAKKPAPAPTKKTAVAAKPTAKSPVKAPPKKPVPAPVTKTANKPDPVIAAPPVAAKAAKEPTPGRRSSRGAAAAVQVPMPDPAPASRFADRFAPMRPASRPIAVDAPVRAPVKFDPKLVNAWKAKAGRDLTEPELLAMPDNEYMNEKQLEFFRARLTALKDDLLSNAGETTEHLREDTSIVPDPADRATIEEEHALELRTRDRERKLLKKISQSLARIEAGEYGFCDETGEPIGLGRLLARPTATLSLEAQQRRELKQKMFGD